MITEVSAELSWLRKIILEKEQEKNETEENEKQTKMKQKKRNKQNDMHNKRAAIWIAHRFWQYAKHFLLIAWVNLVTDFKQHVVVVFDIMLSRSVSQSRVILWHRWLLSYIGPIL